MGLAIPVDDSLQFLTKRDLLFAGRFLPDPSDAVVHIDASADGFLGVSQIGLDLAVFFGRLLHVGIGFGLTLEEKRVDPIQKHMRDDLSLLGFDDHRLDGGAERDDLELLSVVLPIGEREA